jgi:maltose O-acetyltransferase
MRAEATPADASTPKPPGLAPRATPATKGRPSWFADEILDLRPRVHLIQGFTNYFLPQFCFNRLRTALWRAAKIEIGPGSMVMGDLLLSGDGDWPSLFTIGRDTYISGPLRINLGGAVRIGDRVNVGHDCLFVSVDHEIGEPSRRAGVSTNRPITIQNGVWIASKVVILPGVTIGEGAVVATGAVVRSDVPAHTLVGGVPAKVLRTLQGP